MEEAVAFVGLRVRLTRRVHGVVRDVRPCWWCVEERSEVGGSKNWKR